MPSVEEIRDELARWLFSYEAAAGRKFYSRRRQYESLRHCILDSLRRNRRILIDYAVLPREIHLIIEVAAGETTAAGREGNRPGHWAQSQ